MKTAHTLTPALADAKVFTREMTFDQALQESRESASTEAQITAVRAAAYCAYQR
jgi:hypothetical protein